MFLIIPSHKFSYMMIDYRRTLLDIRSSRLFCLVQTWTYQYPLKNDATHPVVSVTIGCA